MSDYGGKDTGKKLTEQARSGEAGWLQFIEDYQAGKPQAGKQLRDWGGRWLNEQQFRRYVKEQALTGKTSEKPLKSAKRPPTKTIVARQDAEHRLPPLVIGGPRAGSYEQKTHAISGPGADNYTAEQWDKMSGAQRTQANVDAYKTQTADIRASKARIADIRASKRKPEQTRLVAATINQMSQGDRERALQGYRMAVGGLQNDLRRGRLTEKKGKIIGEMLQDHYNKALGGDLSGLMEEEARQKGGLMQEKAKQRGELMTQRVRNEGGLAVAQEQQANVKKPERAKTYKLTNIGSPIEPKWVQEDSAGGITPYSPTESSAPLTPEQRETAMRLLRIRIEGLPPEKREAGIAEFKRRFPGVDY